MGATKPHFAQTRTVSTEPHADRPLRVLHVVPGSVSGNEMGFVRLQIASLTEYGVRSQVHFIESRTSPRAVLASIVSLRRELARHSPDLVHVHYGTMTAAIAAVSGAAPLLISFRGSDLQWDPAKSWARDFFSRSLSQLAALRAAGIVCVSDELSSCLYWKRPPRWVISDGINLDVFSPTSQLAAREALGWPQQVPIALFSARLDQIGKGGDFVAAVVAKARQTLPQLRLETLRGQSTPPHVAQAMNAADCLLFASLEEGSPNITKEAIACGLPVIANGVGDVAAQLAGVTPGALLPRTVEHFANALLEICQHRERSNGPLLAKRFATEHAAQQILSVYRGLLGASDEQ